MMMGRWFSEQFDKSYPTTLPVTALLAQAGVSKEKIDYNPQSLSYSIPRSEVEVPSCLKKLVFPWAELALEEVKEVRFNSIFKPPIINNF